MEPSHSAPRWSLTSCSPDLLVLSSTEMATWPWRRCHLPVSHVDNTEMWQAFRWVWIGHDVFLGDVFKAASSSDNVKKQGTHPWTACFVMVGPYLIMIFPTIGSTTSFYSNFPKCYTVVISQVMQHKESVLGEGGACSLPCKNQDLLPSLVQ